MDTYSPTSDAPSPAASLSSRKASKRVQVSNACQSCREKKVKCSGNTPQCNRCQERNIPCSYDFVPDGKSKMEHLKIELDRKSLDLERTNRVLDLMTSGTDFQAVDTLARIRLGQPVDEILEGMPLLPLPASQSAAGSAPPLDDRQMVPPFAAAMLPGGDAYNWQAVYGANMRAANAEFQASQLSTQMQPPFADAAAGAHFGFAPGVPYNAAPDGAFNAAPHARFSSGQEMSMEDMYGSADDPGNFAWDPQFDGSTSPHVDRSRGGRDVG